MLRKAGPVLPGEAQKAQKLLSLDGSEVPSPTGRLSLTQNGVSRGM